MSNAEQPSPDLFFEVLTSYQKSAALKAALELDLFTAIGDTPATAAEIATRRDASARGIRILCDYLTILGVLEKLWDRYALKPESAFFIDSHSPA